MTDHARFDALADLPFENELERILVQQELSAPQRARPAPAPSARPTGCPRTTGRSRSYIRAYWGEEPILDGSWQPPMVEKRV
jgi:hypothetical protein